MEPLEARRKRNRLHRGFVWAFMHSWQRRMSTLLILALIVIGALGAVQWRTSDELDEVRERTDAQSEQVDDVESRVAEADDAAFDARQISADAEDSILTIVAGTDKRSSQGTAFALLRDGDSTIFVTNRHVVTDKDDPVGDTVELGRERAEYEGEVLAIGDGRDDDVALVRVDEEFPTLANADEDAAEGDPVLAYGSPLGLSDTRTQGIISALRDDFIQFDAQVNPGNSGGPLLDRAGAVLGIVTGQISEDERTGSNGLSFAIDIDIACDLIEDTLPDIDGCA